MSMGAVMTTRVRDYDPIETLIMRGTTSQEIQEVRHEDRRRGWTDQSTRDGYSRSRCPDLDSYDSRDR